MKSFLHLTSKFNDNLITARDVFRNDVSRFLLSVVVIMGLAYLIGFIIASSSNRDYDVSYFVWLFFAYTPSVKYIFAVGACVIALGAKTDARFWSTFAVAAVIASLNVPSYILWHIDNSGYLSIFAGILLMICGWRLWDYYEVRKVYAMDEPRLTRPALATYITLGVISIILLIPYGN